jgi:hypothetical protein
MRINRLIDSPNLAESKLYVGFGSDKIIGMYRDSFEFTRDYGGVALCYFNDSPAFYDKNEYNFLMSSGRFKDLSFSMTIEEFLNKCEIWIEKMDIPSLFIVNGFDKIMNKDRIESLIHKGITKKMYFYLGAHSSSPLDLTNFNLNLVSPHVFDSVSKADCLYLLGVDKTEELKKGSTGDCYLRDQKRVKRYDNFITDQEKSEFLSISKSSILDKFK